MNSKTDNEITTKFVPLCFWSHCTRRQVDMNFLIININVIIISHIIITNFTQYIQKFNYRFRGCPTISTDQSDRWGNKQLMALGRGDSEPISIACK